MHPQLRLPLCVGRCYITPVTYPYVEGDVGVNLLVLEGVYLRVGTTVNGPVVVSGVVAEDPMETNFGRTLRLRTVRLGACLSPVL